MERPYITGTFVWTGFDYRGEPWPYEWPCINSQFGIMDTCGFPKDNYYYYKSWWSDETVLHLFPHWNWPGREGKLIEVWCHSNVDEVELILNGESFGRKQLERYTHAAWQVPYSPGVLTATGYKDGKPVVTKRIETTGEPYTIRLSPDRGVINADREDVSLVTVSVEDTEGQVVLTADNEIIFGISGPGKIIGVGNGDPGSHEPDKATRRKVFNGLCQVIVQATGTAGDIILIAESPGLKRTDVRITSSPARLRPSR